MSRNALRLLQLVFIVAAAALAYSFVASARDGELRKSCMGLCAMAPAYAGSDRLAPDFELPTVDGKTFRMRDTRGKTVVLVFWTSTCSACKKQMPGLRELTSILEHDADMEVMTVAVDGSVDTVRKTLQKHAGTEHPFPVALDPESKVVLDLYGTKAFPETWVIGADGIIRARFDGVRDWAGPMALDVLRNVERGVTCPMMVSASMARGPGARICREAVW